MNELLRLSRENIAETYLELGEKATGSRIALSPAFDLCLAPIDLSFCNFALRLRLDQHPNGPVEAAEELASHSRRKRTFRVFMTSGDTPPDAGPILASVGFGPSHSLVQMAATPNGSTNRIEWVECTEYPERLAITEFMVGQFFGRQGAGMRNHIISATVQSCHRLFKIERRNRIVAGVMLTGMESAVGLYNLCVQPAERKKGLGGTVVRSVLALASELGLPTCLQCDRSLERWYRSLGFGSIGMVQAFSYNASHF